VPAERERAAARVASRTKRATLRLTVRMSAKMEALALLALPYQGERFPGGAFHAASGLIGIAGFSVALTPHAQLPDGRVDFQVTSQADVAVGEREINGDHGSQGVFRVPVGTDRG
jgi:hypothetical protein